MKVAGFSFVHNALEGGYPIVEAVRAVQKYMPVYVVDMASTDGTREVLEKLGVGVVILDGEWVEGGNGQVDCLNKAYAMNVYCDADVIVHFEADEVYSDTLIGIINYHLTSGKVENLKVMRVQVSQNFQRIRWYPWPVHRVFPRGSTVKQGHTSNRDLAGEDILTLSQGYGLLWDVTFNFRDNVLARCRNNAFLYGTDISYKFVPDHFAKPFEYTYEQVWDLLKEEHWEYQTTFIDIPEILKPLVGETKYKARI
jgi:glycosyltransferase involved in cell wall biosynthesis